VSYLLITNDDGVDSPAVPALARALAPIGRVEVVVPDRERSWVGKAITRHDEISVARAERDGVAVWTTTGYPADCTQLGVHALFEGKPRVVVSGINIGFNFGAAYMLSSGTVGAAVEAWISGVPAVALSAGTNGDWPAWSRWVHTADASSMWERLAAVGADIVATILDDGFPAGVDVISVNLPENADLDTPRRVVDVARVGYDRLFGMRRDNVYAHEFGGGFVHFAGLEGTDVETARRGEVAITPILLHQPAAMPETLRGRLER
jgi:5'-nucleotidase